MITELNSNSLRAEGPCSPPYVPPRWLLLIKYQVKLHTTCHASHTTQHNTVCSHTITLSVNTHCVLSLCQYTVCFEPSAPGSSSTATPQHTDACSHSCHRHPHRQQLHNTLMQRLAPNAAAAAAAAAGSAVTVQAGNATSAAV
jgi:hypothetical protein